MCLHRPAGHLELPGNFSVVTPLKQQLNNLLFSGSQLLPTLFHLLTPANSRLELNDVRPLVTKCCSTHHAILRRFLAVTAKH